MLPNEAVVEYQTIYKELFGKEISFEQALVEGSKLINLVFIIERKEMKNETEKSRPTGRY